MLNLYAVKVWYASQPTRCETIEVRTYAPKRAELLARESFPGCMARATTVDATAHDTLRTDVKTKAA